MQQDIKLNNLKNMISSHRNKLQDMLNQFNRTNVSFVTSIIFQSISDALKEIKMSKTMFESWPLCIAYISVSRIHT